MKCSEWNAGKSTDFYYYRDADQKEIDLLFVEGDTLTPVEIKKSKEPTHPDKNFTVLNKLKKNVQPAVILCLSDEMIPYQRNTWYYPIWGL